MWEMNKKLSTWLHLKPKERRLEESLANYEEDENQHIKEQIKH